jgi:hypothetical protein
LANGKNPVRIVLGDEEWIFQKITMYFNKDAATIFLVDSVDLVNGSTSQ